MKVDMILLGGALVQIA